MKTTIKISSPLELVGFLRSLGTTSTFISMRTETVVEMRKTKNPYVGTVKVQKRNGLINVNFVRSVERNMEKAGIENPEYVAGKTWYVHESTEEGKPLPLCIHKKDKNKFYLQYYPHKTIGETTYWLNGKQLTKEQVSEMQKFVIEDKKDTFKPIVLTFSIDSIRELKARQITILNHTISRLKKIL